MFVILMVSVYWEVNFISIILSVVFELIYDYYGFFEFVYSIEYLSFGELVFVEKVY